MKTVDELVDRVVCRSVLDASADYLDRRCTEFRSREIQRHLDGCAECAARMEELAQLRRSVRSLPSRTVPANVAVGLRVVASREHARRAGLPSWGNRLLFWMSNRWRPLGLPMAGGLASACVLFATMMPTFAKPVSLPNDQPPAWYRQAELSDMGPFGVCMDHLTLDVDLDQTGRMVDYRIPDTETLLLQDLELRRQIENNLLFMQFKPAAFFGQPTAGKIRINIRRSQLDVKG